MTESTWEKPIVSSPNIPVAKQSERLKFLIGGVLLLGAVIYLILSGTASGARYFITVEKVVSNPAEYVGQTVRISGAVIGDTIAYEEGTLTLDFTIANIPDEIDDLALMLHNAVSDPNSTRLVVHMENEVKPDLLQNEAQAILTGKLGEDGVFYASELLLKCPSRYEESNPAQAVSQPEV